MGRPNVSTFMNTQSQAHPKESTTFIPSPWQMQYGLPLTFAFPLPSIIAPIITRRPQLNTSPTKGCSNVNNSGNAKPSHPYQIKFKSNNTLTNQLCLKHLHDESMNRGIVWTITLVIILHYIQM